MSEVDLALWQLSEAIGSLAVDIGVFRGFLLDEDIARLEATKEKLIEAYAAICDAVEG